MSKSIYYVNGQEAALKKLGYSHDDYMHYARDHRDVARSSREAKEHRARAFAGKALRNPDELENLKNQLTEQEIADARTRTGLTGSLLGGTAGYLGGGALAAMLGKRLGMSPLSAHTAGSLGGAALGGYGGYKLMEPMGEDHGRASAEDLIDLAHTHGLQTMPRPSSAQG